MSSREILILSGPNLDLLGVRDVALYGSATLDDHVERLVARGRELGVEVAHRQSNFEGDLIEAIHDARENYAGIIINAGALTHGSWALRDALAIFAGPKVEVHLSNPAAREPFRHLSTIAAVVNGSISGFGGLSYDLALEAVVRLLDATPPASGSA